MSEGSRISKRSLKDLLETNNEAFSGEESETDNEELGDALPAADPANCCECGDQPKELVCLQCEEPFCQVCFDYIHRTGKRREHAVEYLKPITSILSNAEGGAEPANTNNAEADKMEGMQDLNDPSLPGSHHLREAESSENTVSNAGDNLGADSLETTAQEALNKLRKDAAYIPMRLTMEERKLLRLLEAALEVSEYTDRVDIYMYAAKAKRIVRELREICTVLTGLVVANGMDIGKVLVDGGDFSTHAEWYQSVFEVGRRYKIMNPERMRSNYGKLTYIIMDSRLPEIKQVLDFDLYKPVLTVESHLKTHDALEMLNEPLLLVATMEIDARNRTRREVQQQIKRKERAIESLTKTYGEPVRQALYSLGDYHAYLAANKTPVEEMIKRLRAEYDADIPDQIYGLGISGGRHGARLTHNHKKQYQYVLQSLTLWSELMGDMFLLWKSADDDLLAETHRYRLEDTGQGLNRIKSSPKVSRIMHTIIARAQRATGSWVGSSVVHLGDRAVPNALFFLDKYLQVPRILNPVDTVIRLIPQVLGSDKHAADWVDAQYGSAEALQKVILTDFFRYAFDGSGADNFYDAGSCIDGRLTSAWNWANQLPKKPYYKHFLICGFIGFDGTEGF